MTVTLGEFIKILEATGYPVAYSHSQQHLVIQFEPPYICFLVDGSANLMADNKVYHKINDLNIELYTIKRTWLQKPSWKRS